MIERDHMLCEKIREKIKKCLIINGDIKDESILEEAGVRKADLFLALTNFEESNIFSAMLAKKMGAHKTIALVNNPKYVQVAEKSGLVDIAISPNQMSANSILRYVRQKSIINSFSLRQGFSEAMEVVIGKKNILIGQSIEQIDLPKNATAAAIVRKGKNFRSTP